MLTAERFRENKKEIDGEVVSEKEGLIGGRRGGGGEPAWTKGNFGSSTILTV